MPASVNITTISQEVKAAPQNRKAANAASPGVNTSSNFQIFNAIHHAEEGKHP